MRTAYFRYHCINTVITEQAKPYPNVSIQLFKPQSRDGAYEPRSSDDHVCQIGRRDIHLQKNQVAEL
ncbi:MAG TPA: hypothetical protein HPP54_06725 [Nitrospinae bacterium]|nr:hypothetical protein [Nitrospinota bacterium]